MWLAEASWQVQQDLSALAAKASESNQSLKFALLDGAGATRVWESELESQR
jgi:hypothetical protein